MHQSRDGDIRANGIRRIDHPEVGRSLSDVTGGIGRCCREGDELRRGVGDRRTTGGIECDRLIIRFQSDAGNGDVVRGCPPVEIDLSPADSSCCESARR